MIVYHILQHVKGMPSRIIMSSADGDKMKRMHAAIARGGVVPTSMLCVDEDELELVAIPLDEV